MRGLVQYINEAIGTEYTPDQLKSKKPMDILEVLAKFDWNGEELQICKVVTTERVSNTEFQKIAINMLLNKHGLPISGMKLYDKTKTKLIESATAELERFARMRSVEEVLKVLRKKTL